MIFNIWKIKFENEFGTCLVSLGNTKVFCHVSGDISASSNSEGSIYIKTEFSPMAFPTSEGTKSSDAELNLSRMLEKALMKTRAIDTEGLCIIAGEKVSFYFFNFKGLGYSC